MAVITTVTIGRNVGTEPLHDEAWKAFQFNVSDALSVAAHSVQAEQLTPITGYDGVGEWEGVTEESAIFTVVTSSLLDETWLRDRLAVLAGTFHQDAIALSVGTSSLIAPHSQKAN